MFAFIQAPKQPMGRRTMILRPASLDDVPALARLGRDSFCAAFAHLYRPDDLTAFVQQVYAEPVVASEIADPGVVHRLAEDDRGLSGYCKLRMPSKLADHSDAGHPIELAQLYTAPDRTGRGIGAALMEWSLAEARERGCDAVQLSVWSENLGAQRFYARYGFSKIADIDFWVGTHRDDEFLYELRL